MASPAPFSRFEWMIAWRYLRARRAEGGVGAMTWISLLGITLAVFALIATLAVRSGFRDEFVDTILGANAHVTVYAAARQTEGGGIVRTIPDYVAMAARVAGVEGVTRVAPLVKGQVMATHRGANAGVEVFGIAPGDLAGIPRIADPVEAQGSLAGFGAAPSPGDGAADQGPTGGVPGDTPPVAPPSTPDGGVDGTQAVARDATASAPDGDEADAQPAAEDDPVAAAVAAAQARRGALPGIAIGSGVSQVLNAGVGDSVRLISPDGARTPFGTSPRVSDYRVDYIFTAGRYDIDRTRVYMPFDDAQLYFNREGAADELEVTLADPDAVDAAVLPIMAAAGDGAMVWTWKDASGSFLRALDVEDNVMFVILSILVLIAAMNIVSGLIMLVKNKGRDIGILRTVGLSEGSVLRVFFLCGSLTGIVGTAAGVVLGCLFAIWIDPIFAAVNWASGGGVWDPSVRGIYALPAKLQAWDVARAVALSLGLSFVVTIFPARRAARMNPVEALRYE